MTGTVYAFAALAGLTTPISPAFSAETTAFGRTVELLADKKWSQARDMVMRQGNAPVYHNMYEWMLYCEDDITGIPYDRVADFITRHPDWPAQEKLRATAERVMPANLDAISIVNWFQTHPPVTGQGALKLINATGTGHQGIMTLLNQAWPDLRATQSEQERLLGLIGRNISPSSHMARLDQLLHNQQYTLARNLATYMGNGYPQVVEARIALMEGKPAVGSFIARVPEHLQNDPGLLLERIRWRRKNDDDNGAVALLNVSIPKNSAALSFPEDWWKERNILVRRLIEKRDFRGAYTLASKHNLSQGSEYAEAEWMAGWLALRFLRQPDVALGHFTDMYGNVETAISKARAAYWAGRAAEVSPTANTSAAAWFVKASTYPHAYYGQLAIRHSKRPFTKPSDPMVTAADQARVSGSSLVQAAIALQQTSYDKMAAQFLNAATKSITTPGEFEIMARTLAERGNISASYRVAKAASWKNIFLGRYYTPSLVKRMTEVSLDKSLMHAIIRQESQFDTYALSPSGAMGLSQLMPPTAAETARKEGLDYRKDWLMSRPDYNIRIGAAYLERLLERYNGSYPLAIAAYNAGPGRVNQWISEFGDPRNGKIDWIDWLETIPVAETRNYVQRVTEGVIVYREYTDIK